MKQHTIKDSGPPLLPPDEVSQHYVDLTSGDVYISTGTRNVEDWGKPIVKTDKLDATVREVLAQASGGDAVEILQLVEVFWDTIDLVKRATVTLPVDIGSMIRVVDDTDRPGPVYLKLDRSTAGSLREGMKIPVLNSTGSQMLVISSNPNDTIDYAGHRSEEPYVMIDGYTTIRFLGNRGMGFHFIVTGDTNRTVATDDIDAVTNTTFEDTLDGMTRVLADALDNLDQT